MIHFPHEAAKNHKEEKKKKEKDRAFELSRRNWWIHGGGHTEGDPPLSITLLSCRAIELKSNYTYITPSSIDLSAQYRSISSSYAVCLVRYARSTPRHISIRYVPILNEVQ